MGILDILFPWQCAACGKSSRNIPICDECFKKIDINDHLFCANCRSRIPAIRKICHLKEPCLIGGASFYKAETEALIKELKFKFIKKAAIPLGNIIVEYLRELIEKRSLPEEFILVPIPLGKKRLRERSFNQTDLIAEEISRSMNVGIKNMLSRNKETSVQSLLPKEERLLNIKNAFRFVDHDIPKEKTLILIDDVIASGSTIKEAAETLKNAGYKKVLGIAASISES